MTIRSLFKDFTGTFVTHCHRLDHEDNGLMMTINVIPAVSTYAVATQQGKPRPRWRCAISPITLWSAMSPRLPIPGTSQRHDGRRRRRSGIGPPRRQRPRRPWRSGRFLRSRGAFTRELARFRVFGDDFRGG